MSGPCLWPLSFVSCGNPDDPEALPSIFTKLTDDQQLAVQDMATEYLWRWTGRQFGVCEVSLRPCRQDCTAGDSTFIGYRPGATYLPTQGGQASPFQPALLGGEWFNIGCGSCGDQCGCDDTPTLRLPGPIDHITEIRIGAEVVPESAYTVQNRRYLLRVDGGAWPTCQQMSTPVGEPGSWQISYGKGLPVPPGGQIAAGVLATELAKALCRDKSCGLPERVQTVTRQGVTVALLDAFDDIDTGHTGIWIIDSWVASVTKAPVGGRVFSPDVPRNRHRRQTWPV